MERITPLSPSLSKSGQIIQSEKTHLMFLYDLGSVYEVG